MFHEPVRFKGTTEGGLRRLTLGEINLATSLFNFSIHYHQVWIHLESYLPFNIQNPGQAMSPNGEMWFRAQRYKNDFSRANVYFQHLFLHEMMHIWQQQRGAWVRTRGLISWAVDYSYRLDKTHLQDYGLEQQASIVSDFWMLEHYGFQRTPSLIAYRDYDPFESEANLIAKYQKVLVGFPG